MKIFLVFMFLVQTASAAVYKLDPVHTTISFSVKHLMVSNVKGQFQKFEGAFDYDSAKKELKDLNVTIHANSINTNQSKRDDHLRSEDFLAVKTYPKIIFKQEKAEIAKDGKSAKIQGVLTIRDKTHPVYLEVTEIGETEFMGVKKIGFSAKTKINRKDYNVNWNKTLDGGGVVVGDDVSISIDGEADLQTTKK
jgi:polyisoprenoid-binding protein YceI